MMQDDRTNAQAAAGLLQMPTSVVDRMDERHGKFSNRLSLFGHLLGGGTKGNFGDADIRNQYDNDMAAYNTQQARQLLNQRFEGLDMNNLSMADVATITQLDPGLGKLALENFTFGQQVGDLGRAQEFMNDGVEDENDLWAAQTMTRYGMTQGGATGAVSAAASSLGISPQEFLELPAEVQETALYNMGDDGYRTSADVLGGRDLETIQSQKEAEAHGASAGELYKGAVTNVSTLHDRQRAGYQAIEQAEDFLGQLESGELDTGMIQNAVKKTFDIYTRADGQLDLAGIDNMIERINQATFGALSENEMKTLRESFASMAKGEEYNKGVLDGIIKKTRREMGNQVETAKRDLSRIKRDNPEEYDQLMQDDYNWRTIGPGSDIKGFETANGQNVTFDQYWEAQSANGASRDEIVNGFAALKAQEKAKIKIREDAAAEEKAKADSVLDELINDAVPQISPYIARPR